MSSYLVFPTFFLGFLLIWVLVIKLIMWLSGLTKLASRHPFVESRISSEEIKRWDYVSGSINKNSFRNALSIVIHEEGLLISPFFLFRVGAGKALIPWSEVQFNGVSVEGCFEWTDFEAAGVRFHLFGNMEEIQNFAESSSE